MKYTREQYARFLNLELCAETEKFNKVFTASALYLLHDQGALFLAIFLKVDRGEMIVKFRGTRPFPRKGEYLYCMYLPVELQDYRRWGDQTYEELFKKRLKGSEAVCVWQSKSDDEGYILAGFRNVDIEFAEYIGQAPGAMLVFAPNKPPIEYLANLYKITHDTMSKGVSEILDADLSPRLSRPKLITTPTADQFVYDMMLRNDTVVLQGPPGTGKTHLIAEIVRSCCDSGKSVLVTALTNRALMEVAEKEAMADLLLEGRVYKANLKIEEQEELKYLQNTKQIMPMPGCAVLATYYITSGFAAELAGDGAFDYVIMDEASQALLLMFAAAKKMGRRGLWVGDVAQLPPIVSLQEGRLESNHFEPLVNGLQHITSSEIYPVYQLTHSYRYGSRAASYTGIFYHNTLHSVVIGGPKIYTKLEKILDRDGGPSLILTDMNPGDVAPQYAVDMTTYLVGSILAEHKDTEVSVLTCLKRTTSALQKGIAVRLGLANKVIIETVARVQGLTSDITVFFIPNASLIRSLEPHLFNVATSRAKEHTIIIAEKNILQFSMISPLVRSYLGRLMADRSVYVPTESYPLIGDKRDGD